MRRADRLFTIVQFIRGRRLTTAAWLAERLEVSERTVYRDVATLQSQGVPIEGEAGVGYRLGKGFELPPLMFTTDEARALVAAVRVAQPWLDAALAGDAEAALGRIFSVLPTAVRTEAERQPIVAPPMVRDAAARGHLRVLRQAAQAQRKLRLSYRDESGATSERTVRPLACVYWGRVWTLAAWCELRDDFRSFRVDRLVDVTTLDDRFGHEPGKTWPDMLRRVTQAD